MRRENLIRGFTIVELLIVVVVIAILAAITIVSYNGIANQAHDTTIKNDLAAIKEKIEIYHIDKGIYPKGTNEVQEASSGFRASKGSYMTSGVTDHNFIYCMYNPTPGAAVVDYTVVAYSKSGKKFRVTKDAAPHEYTTQWTNQTVACTDSMAEYSSNYRGYAADDTVAGPWRAWVNGS